MYFPRKNELSYEDDDDDMQGPAPPGLPQNLKTVPGVMQGGTGGFGVQSNPNDFSVKNSLKVVQNDRNQHTMSNTI